MSLPIDSKWPLCKIDAIDPFPFHGLQYTVANQEWVDPMDGRPPFLAPPRPGSNELPTFLARQSGCLWDIGRADPPDSPQIGAAGGRAIGKRIVDDGNYSPCRIGDRTYQLNLGAFTDDGVVQLYWERKGVPGSNIFAEVGVDAFGLDWENAITEGGMAVYPLYPSPAYGASVIDKSPDGRRHLVGVRIAGNASSNGWANSMVGIIDCAFSIDEDGGIQCSAQIIKVAADLMGTYTEEASSHLQRLTSEIAGYPWCRTEYMLRDALESEQGQAGTAIRQVTRTGYVIGALYAGDGIEFITVDYEDYSSQAASISRPPRQTGIPTDVGGEYVCEPFPPGEAPPLPPLTQTVDQSFRTTFTIRYLAHSVTGWINYDVESTITGAGAPYSQSSSGTRTASVGTEVTTSDAGETQVLFSLLRPGTVDGPGKTVIPSPVWRRGGGHVMALTSRRSWASIVITEYQGGGDGLPHDAWWLPMLTPVGVQGEPALYPMTFLSSFPTPSFRYGGAYNPITGQGLRNCDVGREITGWI